MLAAAQVINGIAQRLATVPATGGRVHTARTWPLTDADLPAWRVLAADEVIATATISWPAHQQHELSVDAIAYCRATANVDDVMHAVAADGIRAVLGTIEDASLAPLDGVSVTLASIQRDTATLNEAAVGRCTVTFNVTFATSSHDPETLL